MRKKDIIRLAAPRRGFKRVHTLHHGDKFRFIHYGEEITAIISTANSYKRPEKNGGPFLLINSIELSRKKAKERS